MQSQATIYQSKTWKVTSHGPNHIEVRNGGWRVVLRGAAAVEFCDARAAYEDRGGGITGDRVLARVWSELGLAMLAQSAVPAPA